MNLNLQERLLIQELLKWVIDRGEAHPEYVELHERFLNEVKD